jgi:predicted TIM-barrel fold metal-dependent hydrolase
MRSQKKATQAARDEWRKALAEGRVVKTKEFPDKATSYPTVDRAKMAIEDARKAGLTAYIVTL